MSPFYSPLRYPGGKNCISPFMTSLIRENGLENCSYAEPFAGGAGLALHLLMDGTIPEVYLNDLDHSIFTFWNVLLSRTDEFCDWIANTNVCMNTWHWAKETHHRMHNADDFELATATFFLNRANVSGIITGGPIGGPQQTGKYKIDARFNKTDLIRRIRSLSEFKQKIHLSNLDGVDFLKQMDTEKRKFFIYLDPPYVKKGSDLYMNFFDKQQHTLLRDQVTKLNQHWLISYDNSELVNDLYSDYSRVCYKLSQCTSNRMGDEIIISPPNLKMNKSVKKLKQPVRLK